jgi:hypothetical protein
LCKFTGNEENTLLGFLIVDEAVEVAILNEAKGGGQKLKGVAVGYASLKSNRAHVGHHFL